MRVQDLLLNSAVRATPGDLPGMFAALLTIMAQQAADIADIRKALATPAAANPDATGEWAPIPNTTSGWVTAQQAQVIRVMVTSDTSDLFTLTIGNDNQKIQFGCTSYAPTFLDFSGPARLYVTAGLPMKVTQVRTGGTALIWAFVCYIPGDNDGRKSK